jgi:hypothetical protein
MVTMTEPVAGIDLEGAPGCQSKVVAKNGDDCGAPAAVHEHIVCECGLDGWKFLCQSCWDWFRNGNVICRECGKVFHERTV